MPKNKKIDKKKEDIKRLIADLKENAPDASKEEIEELENMLDELLEEDSRPTFKKVLSQILSFIIHAAVMYVACLLVFGFFFNELSVDNKFLVFLVSGVVSLVLIIFERIPRDPFRQHFISINLMMFVIIILTFCILDKNVFSVFNFSEVWVFYLISVEAMYLLIEYVVLKKIRLA